MKKIVIVLLVFLGFTSSVYAEIRYKGYNFLILDEVYKNPVITYNNHNKRVDYQLGAIKLCENAGMRLASKDDLNVLIDFLQNRAGIGQINTKYWLKEIATGQIDSHTYINENSKDNAYVLYYNSISQPIQAYIGASNKVSGQNSWTQAICIAEAPPIDDNYRKSIIQDDYNTYVQKSGNSLFDYIKSQYNKTTPGSIENKYLNLVLTRFQKIATSESSINLQDEKIELTEEERNTINKDTLHIINIFNGILNYND